MSNANDDKIIALKAKVEEKKAAIAKAKKFTPITTCSIELYGQRYNVHAINKDQAVALLVQLNSLKMSADNLKVSYSLCGFTVNEWMTDIQAKLDLLNIREEEAQLKTMEDKLHGLLSTDKKVELELESIESLLK